MQPQEIEVPKESGFTSMIDIVFLLLIFFILQPFKMPDTHLWAELPQGKEIVTRDPILPPVIPIVIRVQRVQGQAGQAEFLVNRETQPTAGAGIWDKLLREASGDRNIPVVIDAESGVDFAQVLLALDQCYKAGMHNVRFAAPPGS